MSKRRSPKRTSKAHSARTRKQTTADKAWSPVENAWCKFVDKFQAFGQTPNNDDDKNKPWEAALNAANRAAYAVIAEPATCLHDMELKIKAWAFQAAVEKGDDLTDLANWEPHKYERNSEFIASLRHDVLAMKRLVLAAHVAIGSIVCQQPVATDGAQHEQR